MEKYIVNFEVDIINPKSKLGLSISRKIGTSNFHSELSSEQLMDKKEEVAKIIAKDLTSQGIMVFGNLDVKSISK